VSNLKSQTGRRVSQATLLLVMQVMIMQEEKRAIVSKLRKCLFQVSGIWWNC